MPLANKHIVITGAASGIGKATALEALARHAHVTAIDLNDPQVEKITHVYCDVSKTEDWKNVADQVGKIDCLFLNAGVMSASPSATAEAYDFFNVGIEAYRKIMGVNVDGVVYGLRALVPNMSPGSSIVVTASLAGIHQYSHDPIYALTKHAIVGLTRSLAPTLEKRGICINAICPNRVDTPMLPDQMRSLDYLTPRSVADDVLSLFDEKANGGIWSKTYEGQPLSLTTYRERRTLFSRVVRYLLQIIGRGRL